MKLQLAGDAMPKVSVHEVSIGSFREELSDLLNSVRFAQNVIRVTKHGKTMGLVISEEEYDQYLQAKIALTMAKESEVGRGIAIAPDDMA